MRMISLNKKLVLASISSILVGTVGVIGVMAAIPDADGIVHGCYKNNGGSLRVIDSPSQSCAANETATAWSSQTKGHLLINDLDNADLSEVRLEYLYLPGVSFQNSEFNQTYLTGSNLTNANFSGAIVGDLRLRRANADGTNFSNAKNVGIFAEGASIRNSNFSGASIYFMNGGDFTGADFTNTTFSVNGVESANFTNVDFRGISILGDSFNFSASNLTNANFSGMSITNATGIFSFSNVNLTNANFSNASFNALYSAAFASDNMTNTNFSGAQFRNVDFNQTDLSTANLSGTTWLNVICPDSTNSDNNGNTCIGHTTAIYQ